MTTQVEDLKKELIQSKEKIQELLKGFNKRDEQWSKKESEYKSNINRIEKYESISSDKVRDIKMILDLFDFEYGNGIDQLRFIEAICCRS